MKNSIVKNHHCLFLVYTLFLITFLAQTKVVAQSLEAKNDSQLESKAHTDFNSEQTVRDRLWLFSFATNSDYVHIGKRSVMSAAEANFYLDIPNVMMVQSAKKEAPWGRFDPPFEQYTVALRPLKRIVWSV